MSSCTFVPLSRYDWSLHPALIPTALPWNPTVYCLIAAFCGVSLWMTIELTLQIFFTFKRRKSLYFWSLLICTWGIALHVLGLILKLFNEGNWIISSIIFKIGWVSNVTGFSFVLYSRLNLVVRNHKILRAVLIMICTDAVLFHTPIIIFDFGISSPHPNRWYEPMIVMEKIQVIGFSIQETIISMLYIYNASRYLKDIYTKQTHRVMQLLIFAQLMAIIFDICLITVDCNNMFTLKVIIHPFAYAIKLKMEFIVLNQLLALIKHGFAPVDFPAPDEESPDASGPTETLSHLRSGHHGPFSKVDRSVTEDNEKPAPDSNTIVRDMEERAPEAPADQANPDAILPAAKTPQGHPEIIPRDQQHPSVAPTTTGGQEPLEHTATMPHDHQHPGSAVPATNTTALTSHQAGQDAVSRQSSHEPYMPARSFSDPMPLNLSQRDQDSEAIVSEMERRYLGRFGMELPR